MVWEDEMAWRPGEIHTWCLAFQSRTALQRHFCGDTGQILDEVVDHQKRIRHGLQNSSEINLQTQRMLHTWTEPARHVNNDKCHRSDLKAHPQKRGPWIEGEASMMLGDNQRDGKVGVQQKILCQVRILCQALRPPRCMVPASRSGHCRMKVRGRTHSGHMRRGKSGRQITETDSMQSERTGRGNHRSH